MNTDSKSRSIYIMLKTPEWVLQSYSQAQVDRGCHVGICGFGARIMGCRCYAFVTQVSTVCTRAQNFAGSSFAHLTEACFHMLSVSGLLLTGDGVGVDVRQSSGKSS